MIEGLKGTVSWKACLIFEQDNEIKAVSFWSKSWTW